MTPRVLVPAAVAAFLAASLAAALVVPRPAVARDVPFDDGWRFHRGDVSGADRVSFDDSAWRTLDVPHDWSIENLESPDGVKRSGPFDEELSAGKAATGWVVGGTGWYRKRFRLPALGDRRVEVRFDGVYMDAEVWLNGRLLGREPYGYSSFAFDITPYAALGENVVAVRVRNEGRNSRWYSGSGLYRHVWLTTTGPLRVSLWGVAVTTRDVSAGRANVDVAVDLANEGPGAPDGRVRVRLLGPDGAAVGQGEAPSAVAARGTARASVSVSVAGPRLWSPATPSLYRATVEVLAGGLVVDRLEQRFGIRRIEIDAERGLRVNGVPYEMKGACLHHDNGPLGAAAIDRAEERRIEILKAAGFDAVRTSHNPPSPAFLDAADRLGMLVIDEAFDMWEREKNPQDYHRYFGEWWAKDLAAMVRRDRNHPSVVLWSIGNEINERADPPGLEIARRLIAGVRRDDPTRGVTEAICGFWDHKDRAWTDTDPAFALLDVGGYNYQWREYEKDHVRVPSRVMAGTESFPLEAFESWDAVLRLPYVVGDFVWTGWDYLGESGLGRAFVEGEEPGEYEAPWPWHIAGSGDIDVLGDRKPQSYYREALWRPGVLQVAVHRPIPEGKKEKVMLWGWPLVESHWTWPGQEGRPLQVAVYSSCERVALTLNGKPVGEKATTWAERRRNAFEVPYAPGTLEAVCAGPGDPRAKVALTTAGPAARLRLTADRGDIHASRDDLSYVRVEVVDARGTVVPGARPEIRARVTGPGELAALASADPNDLTGYRGPARRPYQGVAQAIVRPTGAGTLELVAEVDGLPPARLTIRAR
ncbi:MAG TPA: glycoside hydrolase family 2 TIM barrel-domain containing protein [Vicinamibacteria bacterium]|nr:glycoside hydrolase family 2 TIM barrel-domain containing protein [Vicinamibacteria bacterium]